MAQPTGAVGADRREAGLAEHAEVLRHRRLRDAELVLDDLAQLAGTELAVGEQLEQASPHRVAQDVECVHGPILREHLYKSRLQ